MHTAVTPDNVSLSLSDVAIRARSRELVSPFTWNYSVGGVAWVFGSNGSGKSSLLRVLAGHRKPHHGVVRWAHSTDKVLYHAPNQHIPADVRISDFVALVENVAADDAPAEMTEVLLPSSVAWHGRFKTLSTGEAKRLMLWAILRQGTGPLILDEPYEHLSRDVKPVLTAILRWISRRAPVIVATNQDIALQAADTILTLDGSVVEVRDAIQ